MLHRDVDRFDVREGKWIKWYESHLCMYIKSRGELGRKFGIEFVKGMKVCRKKKKKRNFSSLFSIIKASMQTSDLENLFFLRMRIRTTALLYCVPPYFFACKSWQRVIKLFSTFQREFNRVSRDLNSCKISPGFRQVLLAWITCEVILYIYIFSKRENHRRGRKLFWEIIQIYRIDIWERNKFLRFIYSFFFYYYIPWFHWL